MKDTEAESVWQFLCGLSKKGIVGFHSGHVLIEEALADCQTNAYLSVINKNKISLVPTITLMVLHERRPVEPFSHFTDVDTEAPKGPQMSARMKRP